MTLTPWCVLKAAFYPADHWSHAVEVRTNAGEPPRAHVPLLEHADTRRVGSLPRSCALGFASASRSELTACNPPVAWLSVPSFQVTTQPQLEGLVSAAVAADKTLMVRWIASER